MEELSVAQARELLEERGRFDAGELPASEHDAQVASAEQAMAQLLESGQLEEGADGQEASRLFDEGNVGLGVDIVEVERMARLLERAPAFAERVFSPAERAYCDGKANAATHYALRFAAKEAVVKALGTGFAEGIWVRDIEVERSKKGKPLVKLSGRALEVARERGVREFSLSLSYTHATAVACALAITDSSVRASQERKDPMEELAKKFKETRGMLDEL